MGGKRQKIADNYLSLKAYAVAAINGLVNEYSTSCAQVRARWPMGLGKYLLDKLEVSMLGKGVLQVDKVPGKAGNFVYMNGRSVGLPTSSTTLPSLPPACLCTRLCLPSSLPSSLCPTSLLSSMLSPQSDRASKLLTWHAFPKLPSTVNYEPIT